MCPTVQYCMSMYVLWKKNKRQFRFLRVKKYTITTKLRSLGCFIFDYLFFSSFEKTDSPRTILTILKNQEK